MGLSSSKIVIASDHAGFSLKETLKQKLGAYEFIDVGTTGTKSCDYPDFGYAAAEKVASGEARFGIVVCGSGIGISIAANRNKAVRCALCVNEAMAKLARQHNDANMLALGARLTKPEEAVKIAQTFLNTAFEGGRHQTRVDKLSGKNK